MVVGNTERRRWFAQLDDNSVVIIRGQTFSKMGETLRSLRIADQRVIALSVVDDNRECPCGHLLRGHVERTGKCLYCECAVTQRVVLSSLRFSGEA